jgi:chondroitin AC lyase
MKRIFLLITVLCCVEASYAQSGKDIFAILADRMNVSGMASANNSLSPDSLLVNFVADGSWSDVDYKDNSASQWRAAVHWERILLLAKVYRSGRDRRSGDPGLRDKITKAVAYWNDLRPVCRNYWWNAIGVPLRMGEAFLLLGEDLPLAHQQEGITLMKLGIKPDIYDYHGEATGQNLVWLATVHIMTGVMQRDSTALRRAFNAIYQEVKISSLEGIQDDFSFHQHGAMLYSGGYGLSFTRNIGSLIKLAEDTPFQFPEDRIRIFSGYVLDGQQWMIRGHTFDHSATGREIARKIPASFHPVTGLGTLSRTLAELKVPRQAEFQAMAERVALKSDKHLTGNRHFWRSDFMTHHRAGYYSSVKMTSSRILSGESGNGENLKGYYLGHGVHFIYRFGDEYRNIFPVWDWRRVPGTLCEQSPQPLPLINFGKGARGATDFVGGVSDGKYGLTAYDYRSGNVAARRAWFHFDQEIACLATAVSCPTDNDLYQSINQCYLKGDVFVSSDKNNQTKIKNGQREMEANWVWHDSVAYIFPEKHTVTVRNADQSGSWKAINDSDAYSDQQLKLPVFSLWMNLGKQVRDQSFYYLIRPAVGLTEMKSYQNPVVVLRNDSLVQAVYHSGLKQTQVVFYQKGLLKLVDGSTISVDQPVLLIVDPSRAGLRVSVANPVNEAMTVNISINKKLTCDSCTWLPTEKTTIVEVLLPGGLDAGKSVMVTTK